MRVSVWMVGASLLLSACAKVPSCADSDATNLVKKILADEISGGSELLKPDQIASMVEVRNIQTVQKKDNPTAFSCKGDLVFTSPDQLVKGYSRIDEIGHQVKGTPMAPVLITAATALTQSLMQESGNVLAFASSSPEQRQELVRAVASRGLPLEYIINGIEKGEGGATFHAQVRSLQDGTAISALLLLDALGQHVQTAKNQRPSRDAVNEAPSAPVTQATSTASAAPATPEKDSVPTDATPSPTPPPASSLTVAETKPPTTPETAPPAPPMKQADDSPFAPSFDCQKAGTGAERLVCSDRDLARLDVAVALAYSKARDSANDKAKVRSEQLEWMKTRRNGCSDKTCMQEAYTQRLTELTK